MAATHLLATFLYGVRGNDPVTLSVAIAILALTATAAGYFPARRDSRIDPMKALQFSVGTFSR
ncbi:MAG TPA: hypothetical protein VE959_09650 [Bryobacteraceae bacterium]|nr:hypothetical protein [Bryobacteraceae bacterium]